MQNSHAASQEKGRLLDLLPQEVKHIMYDGASNIAATFEGEPPLALLHTRAREILTANPWLAARLCTDNQTGQPSLWVPGGQPPLSPFFEHIEIARVCSTGTDIDALLQEAYTIPLSKPCADLYAGHGFKCLDRDEPLCKIRICTGDDERFVILMSMCHVLGDGRTFSQIYSMLDPAMDVTPLDPVRVLSIQTELDASGCFPGSRWMPRSIHIKNNRRYNWLMASKAMRSTKESRALVGITDDIEEEDSELNPVDFKGGIFRIDSSWLKGQKLSFRPTDQEVGWISSNDVITSWFMNRSKASIGLMIVDTRERLARLRSDHVGNYQVSFPFYPEEYATPAAIRRSLKDFSVPCSEDSAPRAGGSVALITNYTHAYRDLDFGAGCRLLAHFPVFPLELNSPTMIDSALLVFCPREGELAAVLWTNRFDAFFDGTALGEPITLFGDR
jgi:hypothetical protein